MPGVLLSAAVVGVGVLSTWPSAMVTHDLYGLVL